MPAEGIAADPPFRRTPAGGPFLLDPRSRSDPFRHPSLERGPPPVLGEGAAAGPPLSWTPFPIGQPAGPDPLSAGRLLAHP